MTTVRLPGPGGPLVVGTDVVGTLVVGTLVVGTLVVGAADVEGATLVDGATLELGTLVDGPVDVDGTELVVGPCDVLGVLDELGTTDDEVPGSTVAVTIVGLGGALTATAEVNPTHTATAAIATALLLRNKIGPSL